MDLELCPTQKSIKVENNTTGTCSEVSERVSARFGKIVPRLDFLVLPGALYHIIIGAPALTKLRV